MEQMQRKSWPDWPQPSEEELIKLGQVLALLVRFLKPGIVAAVAEDNRLFCQEWSRRFTECGIDPAIYLWEGSPCAFPGIRRHAGGKEIAQFRNPTPTDRQTLRDCLAIDDNDYPKQLWAFVFTGKKFQKKGPDGYQLGHLVDHKEYGNRWREELYFVDGAGELPPLFGLFTSAANAAYLPSAFLRPTDFSSELRLLLQRRALQLHGSVCRVLPPSLDVKPCNDPSWDLERFSWGTPVGEMTNVQAFLEFRHERIAELFEKRRATPR